MYLIRLLLLPVHVLWLPFCILGQSITSFDRVYNARGASAYSCGGSIVRAPDDGYFLSFNDRDEWAYFRDTVNIVRTDSSGSPIWSRLFHPADTGGMTCYFNGLSLLDDGSLIASFLYNSPSLYRNAAVHLSAWGDILGNYSLPGSFSIFRQHLSSPNGTLAVGQTQLTFGDGNHGFVSFTSPDGTPQWTKLFTALEVSWFSRILPLGDGTYVIVGGASQIDLFGTKGLTLTRITEEGSVIWSYLYPSSNAIGISDLMKGSDSTIIALGTIKPLQATMDIFAMEFTMDGTVLWANQYGGPEDDEGRTIHHRPGGGYVACCEPESYGLGNQAALLFLEGSGVADRMLIFGDTIIGAHPFGALRNTDNGFTIFGIKGNYTGTGHTYLIRTEPDGSSCYAPFDTIPQVMPIPLGPVPIGTLSDTPNALPFSFGESPAFLTSSLECIEYSEVGGSLVFPNVFTPNGDGLNKEFIVQCPGCKDFRLDIFNRWGQPVFESTNAAVSWNGVVLGEPAPEGVYFYVFTSGPLRKTGSLTLLR